MRKPDNLYARYFLGCIFVQLKSNEDKFIYPQK